MLKLINDLLRFFEIMMVIIIEIMIVDDLGFFDTSRDAAGFFEILQYLQLSME